MRCSFCSYASHLSTEPDPVDIDTRVAKLEDLLNSMEFGSFGFTGGEPFLVPEFLFKAILLIRKYYPNSNININTNGTGLTPNLVSFLNYNNVSLRVAFSGVSSGEKSLDYAIKLSNRLDTLRLLNKIKSLCLLILYFKRKSFVQDIVDISSKLSFTNLQINPNQRDVFDLTDILFLEKELITLNKVMPNVHKNTSFLGAIRDCPVEDCYSFTVHGTLKPFNCIREPGWKGCPDLVRVLGGVDNIKYYADLLDRNQKGLV